MNTNLAQIANQPPLFLSQYRFLRLTPEVYPLDLNSECNLGEWIDFDKLVVDPTEENPERALNSKELNFRKLSNPSDLWRPDDALQSPTQKSASQTLRQETTLDESTFGYAERETSNSINQSKSWPSDKELLDESDSFQRSFPAHRELVVSQPMGVDGDHSPQNYFEVDAEKREDKKTSHRTQLAKIAAGGCVPPSRYLSSSPAPRPPKNSRGALSVMINLAEKGDLGYADSGSGKNIMSSAYALQKGLIIRKGRKDIRLFQLGNGKLIYSDGRVRAYVKLTKSCCRPKKEWFHILANCPVPLILGMPFLKEAQVLTEKRHLLESCPPEFGAIESVFWIGTPQNRIKCNLDGRNVIAVADYGSDVNLMSLSYAKREGHHIDRRREVRTRLQFGDGSQADTVGQVIVSNLTLDWRRPATTTLEEMYPDRPTAGAVQPGSSPSLDHQSAQDADVTFSAVFDVLPSLPCDVLLGRDFLWATDAFNICPVLANSAGAEGCLYAEFNFTRSLGSIDKFLRWIRGDLGQSGSELEDERMHDEARHEKAYKLWKIDLELERLSGQSKIRKEDERKKIVKDWQSRHGSCRFCNSTCVSP
ncbi:hypothetical protein DL768_005618 [Monosporascus sp. mg162]|nr:hypothetical protein DL768_005618 [Monosporascus sp. mg162]